MEICILDRKQNFTICILLIWDISKIKQLNKTENKETGKDILNKCKVKSALQQN